MKTVDVLKRARALVARPDGWCKRRLEDEAGRVCAKGAIMKACARSWGLGSECVCMAAQSAMPCEDVVVFNDSKRTTQADVVALFDWAIGIEMAGGI
jgi:hypothetical protein